MLGLVIGGPLVLVVAYGAAIEFSCREPWRATAEVRGRITPGMTLAEVMAAARQVEGARPEVALGNGVDGPVRLWVGAGFECQCYVPLEFAEGQVASVGDPDLL